MEHEMKLLEGPFERIRSGEKTLELRLYDEKRKRIVLGDTIRFVKIPELTKSVTVTVTGLLIYPTFSTLIDDTPSSWLGYQESDKEYLKESMCDIYSKEDEKRYGVLGIRTLKIR